MREQRTFMNSAKLSKLSKDLVNAIASCGHPAELGELVAASLGTEKTLERMFQYVKRTRPRSAEELVDEMLAIKAEFEGYRQKKISQYYNGKLNHLMNEGLDEDEQE